MKIRSINPANGVLLEEFEAASEEDVTASVKRAREAQQLWIATPLEERERCFRRLAQILDENAENILRVIKEETGKRIPDGEAELYDVIDAIDYYLTKMRGVHADTSLRLNPQGFPDTDMIIDYVPYGVIGLIMPWNFPFYSPGMFTIACLAAGNSVVLKPSEHSTIVGLTIQEMFRNAGFPESIVEVVIGEEETGKFLVKASVDKIFFVGSVGAGQDIIANAGIKPVQVELGGNSAAIVLDDADIDLAAQGVAWAGTYHSGQDCVGIKRVFVVERVASKFLEKLTGIIKNLRPGIDYGPYITSEAMRTVKTRIEDAVKNGATVLCGGEIIDTTEGRGNWLSPSVILYEDATIALVASETFGNTIPVMVVPDVESAIEKVNHTSYGLSNAIFTKDIDLAKSIAYRMESGMVFINEPFIAIPGWDHWTGWKNSGFGTVESKLMQCLKKKVLSVNKFGHKRAFWYPYPEPES